MTHPKVSNTKDETNPIYDFFYFNPNAHQKKSHAVVLTPAVEPDGVTLVSFVQTGTAGGMG